MKSLFVFFFLIQISLFSQAQKYASFYVPVADSTMLALDVHLPAGYTNEKLPVLIQFERYWRSSIDKKHPERTGVLYGRDKFFNENGYIIVIVDTRGTGASFGTRASEYSPVEVMDAKDILDWVVKQSWSNGSIGSYGTSYTGTTAELLCATQHPALKAVIPGWSDFDLFRSPARPYGLLASSFIKKWGTYVRLLDRNRAFILRSSVNPVSEELLKRALAEHKENADVNQITKKGVARNSDIGIYDYEDCSVVHWQKEIEASNVPMFVLASWMDAGTAEGTIQRLEHFSNPQKVLLMATAHGGWCNASPFVVSDSLFYPIPLVEEQNQMQLDFFDHYVKGIDKGVENWPLVNYFNMGEEAYKTSNVWPVEGTQEVSFYFQANGGLNKTIPLETDASDDYNVDFGVMTSKNNRWTTQMEGPVTQLNERNEMDDRMLVYTTRPMDSDLQITGTPLVRLKMSSTHPDGAVLVYLEDVDENGKSTYITEGGLRLVHRLEAIPADSTFNLHSFNEEDMTPMIPGEVASVSFKMWPTSVLIKKGHSLRIAIAGADKSTFDRTPKRGTPTYTFERNSVQFSEIILPVVPK